MGYTTNSKLYPYLLEDLDLIRQLRRDGMTVVDLSDKWDAPYEMMSFFVKHHKLEIEPYPGLEVATLETIRHGKTPLNGETYCLFRKGKIPYVLTPVSDYRDLKEDS